MALTGIDAVVFGVGDVAEAKRFLDDWGVSEVSATADRLVYRTRDGAEVVVDETSLDLLGGAELDFIEDLSGAFFQMRNPNAASSCGCGNSFSVG